MEVDEIEKTFERLEVLVISMPSDPLQLGPDYLREQISICRGYLNEVSVTLQRLLRERTLVTIRLEALEAEFAIKSDELLTGDLRVTTLPSLTDRQAMINNLLLVERKQISALKQGLQSNSHVEKVVRLRQRELDNTMSALRLQRSLLRDQIRSGSFYGDESLEDRKGDDLSTMSGETLDSLLAEFEGDLEKELPEVPPKSILKLTGKVGSRTQLEDSSEDDIGIGALQDEIEALVAEGGIDETPAAKPITVEKRKGTPLKPSSSSIKASDVDEDMQDFLSQDFEDDLDDLLDDV